MKPHENSALDSGNIDLKEAKCAEGFNESITVRISSSSPSVTSRQFSKSECADASGDGNVESAGSDYAINKTINRAAYAHEKNGSNKGSTESAVVAQSVSETTVGNVLMPSTSTFRLITLVSIGLAPTISVFFGLIWLHSVVTTMLVMHFVTMLFLPILYIQMAADCWYYYKHIWTLHTRRVKQRTFYAVVLIILSVSLICCFYEIMKFICGDWLVVLLASTKEKAKHNGMDKPFFGLALMAAYFIIVNPIVEEFFWRVFLYREFIASILRKPDDFLLFHKSEFEPLLSCCNFSSWSRSASNDRNGTQATKEYCVGTGINGAEDVKNIKNFETILEEGYSKKTFCPEQTAQQRHSGLTEKVNGDNFLYDINITYFGHLVLAMFYTSYHLAVLYHLSSPFTVVPGGAALIILGIILTVLRNNSRFGMIAAIGLHMGVDIGVVITYADIIYS